MRLEGSTIPHNYLNCLGQGYHCQQPVAASGDYRPYVCTHTHTHTQNILPVTTSKISNFSELMEDMLKSKHLNYAAAVVSHCSIQVY